MIRGIKRNLRFNDERSDFVKEFPLSKGELEKLTEQYPTPFHIYDEERIIRNLRELQEAFKWAEFKEYFAVKALPNPAILKILKRQGAGADCSSLAELKLAGMAGLSGEEIILTSNDTPLEEFKLAREIGAIINLDDLTHLEYVRRGVGLPELLCFRYNPADRMNSGNDIIGRPHEAKYGLTREQMIEGYRRAREMGVKRFGLHTMVVSNERETSAFLRTAEIMFELAQELREREGIELEFINLGGGVGLAYRPEEKAADLKEIGAGIKGLYERILRGRRPRLLMESGRFITGSAGWLVSRVIHQKHTYKEYVGLDSCMADLMRPALYGAYHHITILGKEDAEATKVYDVTGSLCENNDKFAIDRRLPEVEIGDLLIIHDTGAHGHAMGFNYNGKLRHAELLIRTNGQVEMIRRAERLEDYFATLKF